MKRFDSILIASDIDGTLIADGTIVPRNRERILDFVSRGGAFALSTGRTHRDIYSVIPNLPELVNAPCILCNGSFLYDVQKDEIINPNYMDAKSLDRLVRETRKVFPDVGFRAAFGNGILACNDDEFIHKQLTAWKLNDFTTYVDIEDFASHPCYKAIVTSYDPERLFEEDEYMQKNGFTDSFTITRSSPAILEFLPHGVSKGFQMDKLRSLYPDRTLYAVGDYDNDLEMLQAADVAACPENALDKIKEICRIKLCNCRDGAVADLIDKIEETL